MNRYPDTRYLFRNRFLQVYLSRSLIGEFRPARPEPIMYMNAFRIAGDACHLLSFMVMFWKLSTSKSVAGISLKTQELYALVFCARYLDLFWNFLSMYNWVMKVCDAILLHPSSVVHLLPVRAIDCHADSAHRRAILPYALRGTCY